MTMKDKNVSQISDPSFLPDVAFLTFVTDHPNAINLKLQAQLQLHGSEQMITVMYHCVKSFR